MKYLPGLPDGAKVYYGEQDCTEGIYGRFVAVRRQGGNIALVSAREADVPAMLAIWFDNRQLEPVVTAPVISDYASSSDWFATHRVNPRKFNYDAPKHKGKEYEVDGVMVSPLTLPPAEIERALHHAVGTVNSRRMLAMDTDKRVVVVFSYETVDNRTGETVYHGHQIKADNHAQLKRLPSELLKKLYKVY